MDEAKLRVLSAKELKGIDAEATLGAVNAARKRIGAYPILDLPVKEGNTCEK